MTKKPAKQSFVVYCSKEYVFLRIALITFPLLCFWGAVYMRLHWLHFYGGILLLIQIYIFSIINQKIIIDAEGIHVKRPFQKTIWMGWPEIRHTGDFSMVHLGSHSLSRVYFFSKKPVYTYVFERSHILPKITEDFIFVLNQPEIEEVFRYFRESQVYKSQ